MKSKVLSNKEQTKLIHTVSANLKYKAIVTLLLDTGLRVSELVTLKLGVIDLVDDVINVRSLKKREGSKKNRDLPLSDRAREALLDYINTLKDKSKDAFLFPTNSESGHLSRIRVYRYITRATGRRYSPHDLRHTFASRIVDETKDIRIAQALLGHESQITTERYCHKSIDAKRKAISKIEYKSIFKRLFFKNSKRKNELILFDTDEVSCHVGRAKEMRRITEIYEQKTNLILLGKQGVGKSHLLGRIQGERILRIDDFRSVKITLKNLLTALVELHDKGDLLAGHLDTDDYHAKVQKASIPALVDLLRVVTSKNEFTIIIDDLTDTTKTGVRAIERLKNHFHIMAAAREVKISYVSMITNFERVDILPFDRRTSYELISKLSAPFHARIKDYYVFRDHVYEQSNGNPLFVSELIDRTSKQRVIDIASVREMKHTTALKDIDLSLIVVLALSSLMVLRYIGSEVGDSGAYRLIGGIFLLFALFARPVLMATKRRFV